MPWMPFLHTEGKILTTYTRPQTSTVKLVKPKLPWDWRPLATVHLFLSPQTLCRSQYFAHHPQSQTILRLTLHCQHYWLIEVDRNWSIIIKVDQLTSINLSQSRLTRNVYSVLDRKSGLSPTMVPEMSPGQCPELWLKDPEYEGIRTSNNDDGVYLPPSSKIHSLLNKCLICQARTDHLPKKKDSLFTGMHWTRALYLLNDWISVQHYSMIQPFCIESGSFISMINQVSFFQLVGVVTSDVCFSPRNKQILIGNENALQRTRVK